MSTGALITVIVCFALALAGIVGTVVSVKKKVEMPQEVYAVWMTVCIGLGVVFVVVGVLVLVFN